MTQFFLIFFLFTLLLVVSSYMIYPAIIWLAGAIIPFKLKKQEFLPAASIIIPAYNEAKHIRQKILNTLALDYPKERLEILVGSDGSTDETEKIVREFADQGVLFFDFEVNRGKTAVQNDLVKHSSGEILIFTDAASFLKKDALLNITMNFFDERVGCVAGTMRFADTDTNLTTQSQGLYWRYEVKIRKLESRIGNLIGVDGPLYAVRRSCYVPLESNIISDLMTPLLVLGQGKKAVFEPEASVYEDPTIRPGQEFNTRRRITLRGLVGLRSYRELINPFRHPVLCSQILFHKILRWFVGFAVLLNLLVCLPLSQFLFFKIILSAYTVFFVAAASGWLVDRMGIKVRALVVPYYFCLVNLAASTGIVDFFRNKQAVSWKPVRN